MSSAPATSWRRAFLFGGALVAAAAVYGACRYDPVPQGIIDDLGDDEAEPSAAHRPGQPCLACHTAYEGAEPELAVAGTIYTVGEAGGLVAAPHVLVTIFDSGGDSRKACTNAAGNFLVEKDDWADVAYPLAVQAGDRTMRSLVGRDGSCASCHLPSADEDRDPVTGAGRDSPGVVVVGATATDPSCGGGS